MIGQVLTPEQVCEQWWQISSLLLPAVKAGHGELNITDILEYVEKRRMFIAVVRESEDEEIAVALACEVKTYPRKKVLNVSYVGGKPLALTRGKTLYTQLESIAKTLECSIIQGLCGPAQTRLFSRMLGLKPVYTVLRKEVSP
jgi:hypothetical protein